MKIKPRPASCRKNRPFWWLEEKVRKASRLGQLNKHNHRAKSEFVRMCEAVEGGGK